MEHSNKIRGKVREEQEQLEKQKELRNKEEKELKSEEEEELRAHENTEKAEQQRGAKNGEERGLSFGVDTIRCHEVRHMLAGKLSLCTGTHCWASLCWALFSIVSTFLPTSRERQQMIVQTSPGSNSHER